MAALLIAEILNRIHVAEHRNKVAPGDPIASSHSIHSVALAIPNSMLRDTGWTGSRVDLAQFDLLGFLRNRLSSRFTAGTNRIILVAARHSAVRHRALRSLDPLSRRIQTVDRRLAGFQHGLVAGTKISAIR